MISRKVMLATMFGLIILTAACHHLVGGGWFYGLGGEKVHFGFNARCIEDGLDDVFDIFYEGQFQYMDKANGVRFHGDINWYIGVATIGDEEADTCEAHAALGGPLNVGEFSGECRRQPGNVLGDFTVYVEDNGIPGPTTGDFISVTSTCTADGSEYHNEGVLGGGNISSVDHD